MKRPVTIHTPATVIVQSTMEGAPEGSTPKSICGMEGWPSARAESMSIKFMYRLSCFGAFAATFCWTVACAAAPVAVPENLVVGRLVPHAMPTAPYAHPDDAPRIV